MTLVIMAAGMGSRFGGLKQIEPFGPNGEFLLDYSVYDAIKYGFNKVVFIIKEENLQLFRDTVGKRIESKIKVEYAFQKLDDTPIKMDIDREKPWGTGQAVLCAKDYIDDNFAVINSDDFYGSNCYEEMAEHLKSLDKNSTDYALVGYHVANTLALTGSVKRGIVESEAGHVTNLVESSVIKENNVITASPLDGSDSFKVKDNTLVSMNALCFTPTIFKYLEEEFKMFLEDENNDFIKGEFLLPQTLEKLIKENKVSLKLLDTDAKWYGVTYKEDKDGVVKAINEMISDGKYPSNLWK